MAVLKPDPLETGTADAMSSSAAAQVEVRCIRR
jgi:hypothetical protein